MGIKQHLVTLARVSHQPEGTAGAQLHVGDLHAPVDAAHDQTFLAPVELECLAQLELQGHEGFGVFAGIGPPGADVVGDAAVAAQVATGFDLRKQRACRAPVLFVAAGIGLEGLLQFLNKGPQFAKAFGPNVLGGFNFFGGLDICERCCGTTPCPLLSPAPTSCRARAFALSCLTFPW